jgi:hypothetical protein
MKMWTVMLCWFSLAILLVIDFVEGTFSVVNTSLYTRKWIFSGRPQSQAEEEVEHSNRIIFPLAIWGLSYAG